MRRFKRIVALAIIGASLTLTQMTALAATTSFNITVGAGTQDPMSKKTLKSGTNHENCFYVSVTSINPSDGEVAVRSFMKDGPISSEEIIVSKGTKGATGEYTSYAEPDFYYYLNSRFESSMISNTIKMSGRYTP